MDDEVQQRIAELALERDFIDPGEMSSILLEVGRRISAQEDVDVNLWIDRGWLDPTELVEILDELDEPLAGGLSEWSEEEAARDFLGGETEVRQQTNDWGDPRPETSPREDFSEEPETERIPQPSGEAARQRQPSEETSLQGEVVEREEESDYDPTDTLTDPPVNYINDPDSGAEEAILLEAHERSRQTDADETDTLVHDNESEEAGEFERVRTTGTGFRPESAVLEAASSHQSIDVGDRFVLQEELGSGGSGRVVRAYDRLLGRKVAMKILHGDPSANPASVSRFIAEAQATGQLEHPNIVPIYDFGVLPSGDAFYTMREVQGDSLRKVLGRLAEQEDGGKYSEEYTLVRLLNILIQVSQAADYAHVRSVIHRDLKPDNIMLGDFGEVLVMDWGLAQVLEPKADLDEQSEPTSSGQTLGTPSYMPPEQARGDLEQVDETSDIYSLGAILYEILTLEPPFTGDGPIDIMWSVVDAELVPPSEQAPEGRKVPDELERICLRAMAKDQRERYGSAGKFHEDLEAWLEGLQPREADRLVEQGKKAARRYDNLLARIGEYNEEVRELSTRIDGWQSPDEKQELWDAEDARDDAEAASARAFCEAVTKYNQALAHDPERREANEGLADLYWTRLRRAEMRRDVLNTIYFKTLVEQYDPGKYEERLEGQGDLRVETVPESAELKLFSYEEEARRLEAQEERELGRAPARVDGLPIGKYMLKLYPEKCRKIQRPIFIERDRDVSVTVRLPDDDQFAEGFRYIPGGPYISGGDPDAFDPRPSERVDLDPFFCATFPVTFGEYLEWFNALYEEVGEEAMERAPQTREAEGLLIQYDDQRDEWVPDDVLIEGTARQRYPSDEQCEYQLPVLGIRAADAEAYARWLSRRDGRHYRLPTIHEWEKAGRGVDGRSFPWGDRFDANFCKMRFSRPEKPPQPEPVGAFDDDISPYGVRDLAGGVQEWCQGLERHDGHRPTKGGGWGQDERLCRLASTIDVLAAARTARIGFRLVYEPDFDDA